MASWRERILEQAEEVRRRAAEVDRARLEQLKREEEAESSGFFGGFALGLVVGAVLALVFAPWKGEQTRELVAERAVQLKERAGDLVAQVRGEDAEEAGEAGAAIEREIDETAEGIG
jgi:YtxH-like protein